MTTRYRPGKRKTDLAATSTLGSEIVKPFFSAFSRVSI
jgi:hypothetical protein